MPLVWLGRGWYAPDLAVPQTGRVSVAPKHRELDASSEVLRPDGWGDDRLLLQGFARANVLARTCSNNARHHHHTLARICSGGPPCKDLLGRPHSSQQQGFALQSAAKRKRVLQGFARPLSSLQGFARGDHLARSCSDDHERLARICSDVQEHLARICSDCSRKAARHKKRREESASHFFRYLLSLIAPVPLWADLSSVTSVGSKGRNPIRIFRQVYLCSSF